MWAYSSMWQQHQFLHLRKLNFSNQAQQLFRLYNIVQQIEPSHFTKMLRSLLKIHTLKATENDIFPREKCIQKYSYTSGTHILNPEVMNVLLFPILGVPIFPICSRDQTKTVTILCCQGCITISKVNGPRKETDL